MNAAPNTKPNILAKVLSGVLAIPLRAFAFARAKPIIAGVIGLGGLVLILGSGFAATWFLAARDVEVAKATLEDGLTALEEGKLDDAREIAVALRTENSLPADNRGGPPFILGAAMAVTAANAHNPDEERNLYEIAMRYLQEAADIGFPAGFEAEGAFRLGESLFRIDRFAEAIPRLQSALKLQYPDKGAIHRMLATAYFLDSEPNLKEALVHSQALLNEKSLTDEELEGAILQQAEIAFRLGDDQLLHQAFSRTNQENKNSPIAFASKVLLARSFLRDANSQKDESKSQVMRQQAKDLLLEVINSPKAPREFQAEASFFLGKLEFATGKADASLSHFGRARRLAGGSALVAAITLEEGDVFLSKSANPSENADSAVSSFLRILKQLSPQAPFVNPWITKSEITARIVASIEKLLSDREFGSALKLNTALRLATDSPESIRLSAEIEMAWGRSLQGGVQAKSEAGVEQLKQAREHLLRAAKAFQSLAERKLATREFATLMQQAAKLYEEGRDFESARKALTRTLDVQGRTERPETLVMLGKVLLDLDRLEEAEAALNECYLSFRRNPVAYRARLLASQALIEQGQLEEAKELLHANLWKEDLSPNSVDWRDSLFSLANLLFTQARVAYARAKEKAATANVAKTDITDAFDAARNLFEEAAQRLNEAVSRYADNEQSVLARYQLAECNRCLARDKMRLHDAHPIQTARTQYEKEAKAFLVSALGDFSIVQTQLNQRADTRELTSTERKMLRNCYFLSADCLFDQHDPQKYEEAIQAYADAAGCYQTEPAAIEAFVQIAACYRKLRRPSDELTAIEQAQAMLARLNTSVDFATTTRATRGEWSDYLNWRASSP